MKKIIFLLFLAIPVYAARGILLTIDNISAHTDVPSPTVIRWDCRVAYQGADVPGGVKTTFVSVAVSSFATPSQVQSAIVTGIQNKAAELGFSVPVGNTFLPTYQTQ